MRVSRGAALAALVASSIVMGAAGGAAADTTGSGEAAHRAVELYEAARAHFDAGELSVALGEIEESLRLLASPNSDLLRAHLLAALERRPEAMEAYAQALEGAKKRLQAGETRFEATVAEAGRRMGLLGASLAEVEIVVVGATPQTTLALNGRPARLALREGGQRGLRAWMEPGEISIEVADGAEKRNQTLAGAAGTSRSVVVDLRPPRSAAPVAEDPSLMPPAAAWVAGGIGLAGFTAFAVLGPLALAADADLESTCSPRCPPERIDDAERGERLQIGANVSVVVGAVGLAVGGIVWLVDATTRASSKKEPKVAPTASGFVLRF